MSISTVEMGVPNGQRVKVTGNTLSAEVRDGRAISVPLTWFPRLVHAMSQERRLMGEGQGIHWEDLDEDISVESLLAGPPSSDGLNSGDRPARLGSSQITAGTRFAGRVLESES